MRRVVVLFTLSMFVQGCDGRTDSAHIGGSVEQPSFDDDEMVDGTLSFDAGTLARSSTPTSSLTAASTQSAEEREKGFEPAPPEAPGIPLDPGPGVTACGGAVLSCEARSVAECLLGQGCARARGCIGAHPACGSEFLDGESCARAGCTWAEHCEGEATPCSLLSEDACVDQPGCEVNAP